jgi:hypothetical protein
MHKSFILLFVLFISKALIAQTNPCDTDIKNYDYKKDNTDTTITLKNGTQLTFNRCEFFDIRDCIEYREIRTLQDLQETGTTTMDNNGNVLLTCGMLKLKFNGGDCTNECLQVAVKVRIPMLFFTCFDSRAINNLYKRNNAGKWEIMSTPVKEVRGNDGKNYFEFYTTCGGEFNCDKKIDDGQLNMVKFKTKKIKNLTSLNISSNCPLLSLNFTSGRRNNIIYAKVPCLTPDSIMLKFEGRDKDGNIATITKRLSECQPKFKATKCKPISQKLVRNILGLFRTRERNIYGKYIID